MLRSMWCTAGGEPCHIVGLCVNCLTGVPDAVLIRFGEQATSRLRKAWLELGRCPRTILSYLAWGQHDAAGARSFWPKRAFLT